MVDSSAYKVYVDNVLLPQTPSAITISNNNHNEEITLANGRVFTPLKLDGCQTFEFDFEIPLKKNKVTFDHELKGIRFYTDLVWNIKAKREPIRLTIERTNGQPNTDVRVILQDYSYTEDAENGNAYTFSLKFTEYAPQINQLVSAVGHVSGSYRVIAQR